jgi:hypothetical protein
MTYTPEQILVYLKAHSTEVTATNFTITFDKAIDLVRALGVDVESQPTIAHQLGVLNEQIAFLEAQVADVQQMLDGRSAEDDPVGHYQFSARVQQLQAQLVKCQEEKSQLSLAGI